MLRIPKLVVLNLTTDCNMRCEYCYASAGETKSYMSAKTAIKIITELKKINKGSIKILFHGGEPLLCFDVIKEVIEYFKGKYKDGEIEYYIQTNCVLLDENKIKYFKENNVLISISIDGLDENSNKCRLLCNNENSIKIIKNSIKILNENSVMINALAVLNITNYKEVPNIIDYFVENNIYNFSFNYFIKGGRGNKNSHLALSNEQVYEATISIIDKIEEYYKKGIILNEKNVYHLIKTILSGKKKYMCANTPCGAGLNIFGITPVGDIYPCDDLSSQPQFCLGNINEEPLEKILESKIVNHFAQCNYSSIKECCSCNISNLCGAGCCSRKFYENESIYSKDPICGFYKLIIPYIKERIDTGKISVRLYE